MIVREDLSSKGRKSSSSEDSGAEESLKIDIEDEYTEIHRPRPRIQKVPQVLRLQQRNKYDYDPKVVSLGPYHHGKPELRFVEDFKHKALDMFVSGSGKDTSFFYNHIIDVIDEIRDCYVEVTKDVYSDEELAKMILLDACFVIYYMEMKTSEGHHKFYQLLDHLGLGTLMFISHDILLLENQIPLWVIKLLMKLRFSYDQGYELIVKYLNVIASQGSGLKRRLQEHKDEPLHILEAIVQVLFTIDPEMNQSNYVFKFHWLVHPKTGSEKEAKTPKRKDYIFRPVTDLRAKGIHFKSNPSAPFRLTDLNFKSYTFHGQLQLPVVRVSCLTRPAFANLIAYELSPNQTRSYVVISYMNFLKSLIETTKDVKELRQRRTLLSDLGSDEEVVEVFKGINTFGVHQLGIFEQVKESIEEHCNNKAKTWMAELSHTYFRSPWNAIALLAANLLLLLTLIQTYFTVHP